MNWCIRNFTNTHILMIPYDIMAVLNSTIHTGFAIAFSFIFSTVTLIAFSFVCLCEFLHLNHHELRDILVWNLFSQNSPSIYM
ncbi:hypothetical protein QL285_081456 [Trifolium repens]|nr:hypothetical protein QL285_081456 [Trifolium repens]